MAGNYTETMWDHANVEVPLSHIKPTGDCVLVRVLPEEEVTASGIVLPQTGKDSSELRMGEVIAAGPGDRVFVWVCDDCYKVFGHQGPLKHTPESIAAMQSDEGRKIFTMSTTKSPGTCKECGGSGGANWSLQGIGHHPMHVKPGDRIWYRRVLANQQIINGELYQFIHEEAHIWAVLEN